MNKSFRRKFQIVSLLLFVYAFSFIPIQAQSKDAPKKNSNYKKSSKNFKVKPENSSAKIFSAGVVNGKAIELIRPKFSPAARTVNVYGVVSVLVLVDENGNVAQAEVKSGHPLLHQSAIKAASQSRFEPFTLSGQPVKIQGIIIYNFVPNQWNWLEIGYTLNSDAHSYYSIKTLSETLPFDLGEEKQLLNQISGDINQTETIKIVVSMIRQRLIDRTKHFWLFEMGLALAEIRKNLYEDKELPAKSESYQKLKILVQNPPADANRVLIERIQKIILLIEEKDEPFDDWQKLEEIFPYVGN